MKRFFYYLILVNMITNVLTYIPRILLNERLTGIVLAIPIAAAAGTVFLVLFTRAIRNFPGMGLPEILAKYTASWFWKPFIFLEGVIWYQAGLFTLLSFINITRVFISPETSGIYITGMFLLLLCLGILMPSIKVLYACEILLLFNFPLILFLLIKAGFNDYFSYDSVRIVFTHALALPSFTAISAALYIFIGFANLIIFNRVIKEISLKWTWAIILFGLQVLFVSVLVPIGFHGVSKGVDTYVFPWISTADSLRMELGFVERVLFIFLLLHINISLISVVIHWHVGIELFKSILPAVRIKGRAMIQYIVSAAFAGTTFMIDSFATESTHFFIQKIWLIGIIPLLVFVTLLLMWAARRKRNE